MTNSNSQTRLSSDNIEYTAHSMMHMAVVCMDPTKLEMLDGFGKVKAGHKFTPEDSKVRVIISGRDWSEKRFLIYGSKSSKEAHHHINTILERVNAIDYDAELIEGPEITNIAVNGDFGTSFKLESISEDLSKQGLDVEYEPEQFPGAVIKIEDPGATFLLFSTGKFIIQGLCDHSEIEQSIKILQNVLDDIYKTKNLQ